MAFGTTFLYHELPIRDKSMEIVLFSEGFQISFVCTVQNMAVVSGQIPEHHKPITHVISFVCFCASRRDV